MEPSKFTTLLLISMLFISSATSQTPPKGSITISPVATPPIVTVTPITVPPPATPPPTVTPPINPPPVTMPPPPPPAERCPIDILKLGVCVDVLGGFLHIGFGDPAANDCCPVIQGLVEIEAAVCLCNTLKLNVLNLPIFLPLALDLLVFCGKPPPPGFTCFP